jgi:hypothetical protein
MISAIILVAYAAFFVITITAIASLPPDLTGLAVPLGVVAGIVVLLGGFLI